MESIDLSRMRVGVYAARIRADRVCVRSGLEETRKTWFLKT